MLTFSHRWRQSFVTLKDHNNVKVNFSCMLYIESVMGRVTKDIESPVDKL